MLHRRGGELRFLDLVAVPAPRLIAHAITGSSSYELALPLVEPFIISGGTMTVRRSLVVVLHDDDGHRGYGESPPFELPFYSEETLAGARHLLEQVLIPRVVGLEFESPEAVDARAPRRACGATASPARRSRRRPGTSRRTAGAPASRRCSPSGSAWQPADRCSLRRRARHSGGPLDRHPAAAGSTRRSRAGYRRVKIKVAPGWDAVPVRAAREVLAGTGLPLTVDANGGYEWPEHERELRALDEAELLYIEQPLHPDELVGHARLAERLRTPVCVDETLRDARAARQIAELGGPLVWNVKVHRVGGLTEVCRIVRHRPRVRRALWAGTMPESGLGSQAALAAAAMPGFVYPSDLEPSTRWFGRNADVIKLTMTPRRPDAGAGRANCSTPGCGPLHRSLASSS